MKNKYLKIPLKQIKNVFEQINSKSIISMVKRIQKQLVTNKSLIKNNDDVYKIVTQADIEIQKYLLNYFENSSLKGTYEVIAEESITNRNRNNNRNVTWKLLIDPLDGTSCFRKQKETWGVMVGACDLSGVLQYSWNMVSSGEIYSSKTAERNPIKRDSFLERVAKGKKLAIDVYDYGTGAIDNFKTPFEQTYGVTSSQYEITGYPAAIWAGWQLYQKKLNGLLWLPSNQGKKWYPDYDLIFLGALQKKGYEILIGKIKNNNALIAVAPTKKDVEKLYQIGTNLVPKQLKTKIIKTTDLSIINNLT